MNKFSNKTSVLQNYIKKNIIKKINFNLHCNSTQFMAQIILIEKNAIKVIIIL